MFLGTGSSIFSIRYIFSSLMKGLVNKIFLSRICLNNFFKYIFHLRTKVACNVKKEFWTHFPVTLKKVKLQKSNLYQINHLKVYFLAYFIKNIRKLNMICTKTQNMRVERCGGPCTRLYKNWGEVNLHVQKLAMVSPVSWQESKSCGFITNNNIFNLLTCNGF